MPAASREFDLVGFAEDLRRNGYTVGPDQCVAAQRVLLVLLAGSGLPPASVTAPSLAPIFCRTPEEQRNFRNHLARWFPADGLREAQSPVESAPEAPSVRRPRKTYLIPLALLLAVIALLIATLTVVREHGATPEAPKSSADTLKKITESEPVQAVKRNPRTAATPFLFLFALGLIWWAIARLVIHRTALPGSPRLSRIRVRGVSDCLFTGYSFRRMLQDLARHRSELSTEIDGVRSVEKTIQNCETYSPVFAFRKVRPEYLVLVERASPRDQQAQFATELIARLKSSGLFIKTFFFQGDPSVLEPGPIGEPHRTLAELNARYPDHTLILFGQADPLYDPLTGQLNSVSERLSVWTERAILIPKLRSGYAEWQLTNAGFLVYPAGEQGLAFLTESLAAGNRELRRVWLGPPYPELLADGSRRWLERLPPTPIEVSRLCVQLQQYLGAEGYDLLAACAVYPALQWDLTLYLGRELIPETDLEDQLLSLLRLPWFRYGTMPNWLRLRLIADLAPAKQAAVRDALERLLYTSLMGRADGFTLEMVRKPLSLWQRTFMRAIMRTGLLRRFLRAQAQPGMGEDHVVVSFLLGRKLGPGEIRYPGGLRELLRHNLRPPQETGPVKFTNTRLTVLWLIRLGLTIGGAAATTYCGTHFFDDHNGLTVIGFGVGPIFAIVILVWQYSTLRNCTRPNSWFFLLLSTLIYAVVNLIEFEATAQRHEDLLMRLGVCVGSILLPMAQAWRLGNSWARVRLAIPLTYAAFEIAAPITDKIPGMLQNVLNYFSAWQFVYLICMFGPSIPWLSHLDDLFMARVTPVRWRPQARK